MKSAFNATAEKGKACEIILHSRGIFVRIGYRYASTDAGAACGRHLSKTQVEYPTMLLFARSGVALDCVGMTRSALKA
jgi:hypothetical protein